MGAERRHDDHGRGAGPGPPQVQASPSDVDELTRWWVSARVPRLTEKLVGGTGKPQDRQRHAHAIALPSPQLRSSPAALRRHSSDCSFLIAAPPEATGFRHHDVVSDGSKAAQFMATHARLLDRRRFELLFGGGTAETALAALAAYRNPDGGYGTGLEPDLRSASSQPV